jgi:hypothetical protein
MAGRARAMERAGGCMGHAVMWDGYYEAHLATLLGTTTAKARAEQGRVKGFTARGARFEGTYKYDPVRKLMAFQMRTWLPPFYQAITGLFTGDRDRSIDWSGECPCEFSGNGVRFSICFAGRALDIVMRYSGPLEDEALGGAFDTCLGAFSSATSPARTASAAR